MVVAAVLGAAGAWYAVRARHVRTTELTRANARLRLSGERLRHALAVGSAAAAGGPGPPVAH